MPAPKHEIRCEYDFGLWPEVDRIVHHLLGRDPSFTGMAPCTGQRMLGYSCKDEAELARLRQLMEKCPEITIVQSAADEYTVPGDAGGE